MYDIALLRHRRGICKRRAVAAAAGTGVPSVTTPADTRDNTEK